MVREPDDSAPNEPCNKMGVASPKRRIARMVKSADTADLKSADLNRSWGFKSPSGHHKIKDLCRYDLSNFEWPKSFGGCSNGCSLFTELRDGCFELRSIAMRCRERHSPDGQSVAE